MKKIELICIFVLLSLKIMAQGSDYQIENLYFDNGDYDKVYLYLLALHMTVFQTLKV